MSDLRERVAIRIGVDQRLGERVEDRDDHRRWWAGLSDGPKGVWFGEADRVLAEIATTHLLVERDGLEGRIAAAVLYVLTGPTEPQTSRSDRVAGAVMAALEGEVSGE